MLDEDEKQNAKDAFKLKLIEKRQALKEQFDADENGTLSFEERSELREYLRSRIRLDHLEDEEDVSIL